MDPEEKLLKTYERWTDAALREEGVRLRNERARGRFNDATERNALAMLSEMASVLSLRERGHETAEDMRKYGAVVECITCGFAEQYVSMDDCPNRCPACLSTWVDE